MGYFDTFKDSGLLTFELQVLPLLLAAVVAVIFCLLLALLAVWGIMIVTSYCQDLVKSNHLFAKQKVTKRRPKTKTA